MKYFFFYIILLVSVTQTVSQTKFGVKGGINLTIFNEDQSQFGESAQLELGYFGGLFLNVPVSDKVHFQPELLYTGIGDFELLNAPIYVEYDVDTNFSLLLGPSLNYFFDIFSRNFKVRGDVAASYELSENFKLNLKYTHGFDELSPSIILFGVGLPL